MPETDGPANRITVQSGVANGNRVEYQLDISRRNRPIYFASDQVSLNASVESAVALAALGGMRTGTDIYVSGTVSSTFIHNQQRLVDIFSDWFPAYKKIAILTDNAVPANGSTSGRVGSFFTGGVDSFYTFLKNRSVITDLVYVHGYDVKLTDTERRRAITAMGRAIENATGVRFIEIETNCIRVIRDYGRWGLHGHGFGLGAVARQLSGYLDRLYIPSSFDNAHLMPWGSHPDTDPLFSDEHLEVIHDGCEAGRAQKIKKIGESALALDHLRVCWKRVEGSYNCGCCEKCLRTMTSLYAYGKLEKAGTFPAVLDPAAIKNLVIYDKSLATFTRDNMAALESAGLENTDIYNAWRHIVNRPKIVNSLIKRSRRIAANMRRIFKKLRKEQG